MPRTAAAGSGRAAWPTVLGTAARDHAILLVLVACFDLALRLSFGSVATPLPATLAMAALMVAPLSGADALLARHGRGFGMATPDRMAASFLGGFAIARTYAVFLAFKPRIFLAVPYRWDGVLQRLDVALHGVDPVSALMSLPNAALKILDVAYLLWYPFVSVGIAIAVFGPRGRVRSRFLLSVVLLWIFGGTVLAAFFSSAGPIYYARITGQPGPFEEAVKHLAHLGLMATRIQEPLWRAQAAGIPIAGGGISAMPSIHVAAVVLIAIGAMKVRRWLGILATAYAAIVFVGSVVLGWHYAVDGYAAAVLVAAIWWLSGRVFPACTDCPGTAPTHVAAMRAPDP